MSVRGEASALETTKSGFAEIVPVQRRLSTSYVIRLGLFPGIVVLMTTKPESALLALLVALIAAAVGFLARQPAGRLERARPETSARGDR